MKNTTTIGFARTTLLAVALIAALAVFLLAGCAAGSTSAASSSEASSSGASAKTSQTAGRVEMYTLSSSSSASSAAAAVPGATRQPGDEAFERELSARLQSLSAGSGMKVNVAVLDLTDGSFADVRGSEPMTAASMIKLLIAAAFLDQVKAGIFSLDDTYTLKADDIVGGTGSLGSRGAGAQITYREAVIEMLRESDNVGANILIDAIGLNAINDEAHALGLSATRLNRRMLDTDAAAEGVENYTSANDVAVLLELIYDGKLVSAQASELMLEALGQQVDSSGIVDGLPADVPFAHKTGTLATVRHDGGIVGGQRPYVVVALCGGEGFTEGGANAIMADIGAACHEMLGNR